MKLLATRQKHIKIADRSNFGWGTVAHYQEDPLASGPDDEKEIEPNPVPRKTTRRMLKKGPTSGPEEEEDRMATREGAFSTRILPGMNSQAQVVVTTMAIEGNSGPPPPHWQ